MLQSKLFTKTRKEGPKDEVSRNAELLIRAGFVHKEMAGVYSFLPLGLRVFRKIENIVREEMNNAGCQELLLTALQEEESWKKTGRWDDSVVDIWFKTSLKNGTELGLGTTHEEPLVSLMTNFISSYKDLPFGAYQIQTKFRNEVRAKSGIMRGREFIMKDLYSFCKSEEEQQEYYEKMKEVYKIVFERLGLGEITYPTFASGGTFSKYSHEFQTITDAGEDVIYLDEEKGIAINKEVYTDEVISDIGLNKENLVEKKSVEVGNIFNLGTKFSEPLGLKYKNEEGKDVPVVMGSYGIGIGRVMGTIAEVLSDDNGLVWGEEVSPFDIHLVTIGVDEDVMKEAEELKESLESQGLEVLWDDRDLSAGEKFADSDLIGISKRVVVSPKLMESGEVEVKLRGEEKVKTIPLQEAFSGI